MLGFINAEERSIYPSAMQYEKGLRSTRRHGSSPAITITRSFGCTTSYPLLDSKSGGVNHTHNTNDAQDNIEDPRGAGLRNCPIVEHGLDFVRLYP